MTMHRATLAVIAFCVCLQLGYAANPTYYWRQGFGAANCAGDLTYAEAYPIQCSEDPGNLYSKAVCTADSVIIYHCEDAACTVCTNETMAFSTCTPNDGNLFSSESYACSTNVPKSKFSSAIVKSARPESEGSCTRGDFDLQVYTSIKEPCKANSDGSATKFACNSNSSISQFSCNANCQTCTSEVLLASCEQDLEGFWISYECFPTAAPTSSASALAPFFGMLALFVAMLF